MDRYKQFAKSVSDWVSQMTPGQVMMLLGVTAGTIVGMIMMVGWLNSINYANLYSGLDQKEAGEVVNYLNDNKIPYKLENGGSTVLVPSDKVYNTRISLASAGLPNSGGAGYSLFDKNNLGMTDFLQNLNFRRALEGELTKTIMELDEVQAARVHIVMPKDRLLKSDQQAASASVVLKLRGNGLARQQINGITHLVASSVEGLKPSGISIVDYEGNLLTSGMEADPIAGLTSTQLDTRKQVETYLEHKAQSMLDDVLGAGKSVIRLTADLNFQQLERTLETYDPNSPSIRSEERTKTSSSTSDKSDETAESSEEGSNETTITNYELNHTVEHIVNAVGSIERVSIAVMVDGIYTPTENEDGVVEMVYQPRSQDELDRIAAIVKSAVGFDAGRNDQIEMVNLEFDRGDLGKQQEALDAMYEREFYMDIARRVGYFMLIAFIILYFRKKVKKLFASLSQLMPKPVVVQQQTVATSEEEEVAPITVAPENRKPRLVDQMQEAAKNEPEELAKVIKTMMVE